MTTSDDANKNINRDVNFVSNITSREEEDVVDDTAVESINYYTTYGPPGEPKHQREESKDELMSLGKDEILLANKKNKEQKQQLQQQQTVLVSANDANVAAAKLRRSLVEPQSLRYGGGCCRRLHTFERKKAMYLVVGIAMAACVILIAITSFAPEPVGLLSANCTCVSPLARCICPRETVEALTYFQMFCLANSRVAAYACYPLYLLMFLTMAHGLNTWFKTKLISEFFPMEGLHQLHVWSGTIIGILVSWHSLWHLIRWGVQGKLSTMLQTQTGWTGSVAIVITPLLVLPMRWPYLQTRISYEVRKGAHYLSWLWAIMLMKHAPAGNIFWIIGSAFLVYLVDWIYGLFVMTFLIPSARFVRLESAVMIKMEKPKSFSHVSVGGYCYLCVPWITRFEWHAFSVFQDPTDAKSICFIIAATGDWTKALHRSITEPIYRRIWIRGPITSPFETATDSDHVISVASGIGITAALGVIEAHADTRKMHLIWMCRDASLLEFIMDYGARFDVDAYTFIFYTGKRELIFQRTIPHNVFVLFGRPDLEKLIISIGVSAQQQPRGPLKTLEELGITNARVVSLQKDLESTSVEHVFYAEITRLLTMYSIEELFIAAVRRSHRHGPVICYEGLRDLVEDIFWKKLSEENLRIVFDHVDKDGSGEIDAQKFISFIKEMKDNAQCHREDHDDIKDKAVHSSEDSNLEYSALQNRVRFDHFRIMYCGGSQPVVKELQEISSAHNIPLELESFAW